MKTKVFVIGFHKTGTTSLELALKQLGFKVCGVDKNLLKFKNKEDLNEYIETKLEKWDAVQEMPWPLIYKNLYKLYPIAKFILTYRDSEEWFNSVVRFFGSIRFPFHKKIYGVPCAEGYEKEYKAIYNKHNMDVLNFFSDKNNFLLMEPKQNFNYEALCYFLGIENLPNENFPHERHHSKRILPNYKLYRDLRSLYWNFKKNY
ncbi:sulfotransferase [Gaetbulibacter sp. M235]|uniref:sulfotransferase n=1 Tax=Gaetbulibacter sp. M235 TaxID=3126510 RepID=UPI00374E784A